METLHANISGKVRRETMGGRSYLVASSTFIVPGVLNGSQGPIFYSAEENARNTSAWNGMPLVVYHPMENGNAVTARSFKVMDKSCIGVALNVHTDKQGKLKGETWFDEERTKAVDSRIYNALINGNSIELSTGLQLDQRPVENGPKTYNGETYSFEAYNYRPDHIAILPDQIGACSVRDGCGVLVNQESDEGCGCTACKEKAKVGDKHTDNEGVEWETVDVIDNSDNPKSTATGRFKPYGSGTGKGDSHEAAQRGAIRLTLDDSARGADAAAQAKAGHNPPSWAVDEDKWEKAKLAADKGEYSDDEYWAVVAHVYQRMGGSIGEGKKENAMNRQQTIEWLVANCGEQWKGKEAGESLSKLSDTQLTSLKTNAEKAKQDAVLANAVTSGLKIGNHVVKAKLDNGVVVANATKAAMEEDMMDQGADESEEDKYGKKTKNKDKSEEPVGNKQLTEAECLAAMPPRMREVWNHMLQDGVKKKAKLIEKMVSNVKDAAKKEERVKFYANFSLEALEKIAEDIPIVNEQKPTNALDEILGNFAGMGAMPSVPVNNQQLESAEIVDNDWMPTINYVENAKQLRGTA